MIRAQITADTLEEFYRQIVAAQEAAHGKGYCSHHVAIRGAAAEGCESYAELGVNQGATLACALLAGFQWVYGADHDLSHFHAHAHLFWLWRRQNGVTLELWNQDSRLPLGRPVDFLLIDSTHTAAHLREELAVHGPHVRRFILVHDTAHVPALHIEAVTWGLKNHATVQHRESSGFGWTLLKKQG